MRRLLLHRRWNSAYGKSTPVYEVNTVVGRDFPDGTRYRVKKAPDGIFEFEITFADGTTRKGISRTNAGAARVACGIIMKKYK